VFSPPGFAFNYGMSLDWGDGTSETPSAATLKDGFWGTREIHRYTRAGVYTVRFHVRDSGGSESTASGTVVVEPLGFAARATRRQHLRTKSVVVTVTPTLAARLQASGTVSVPGHAKPYHLVGAKAHSDHDRPVTVKLGLPAKVLRAARAALRHHRTILARVRITARMSGQNRRFQGLTLTHARRIELVR
jgi:hypothetical protein